LADRALSKRRYAHDSNVTAVSKAGTKSALELRYACPINRDEKERKVQRVLLVSIVAMMMESHAVPRRDLSQANPQENSDA
jgi:hypothetical protein